MRLGLGIILIIPSLLSATTPQLMLERLIAETWDPRPARVEWSFTGNIPGSLDESDEWTLADPKAQRVSGSVVLTLVRQDELGRLKKVAVTGMARLYGTSLAVKRFVRAGEVVRVGELLSAEAEWTGIRSEPLTAIDSTAGMVAVHALVPGRVVTVTDVKPLPIVKRGQTVETMYATRGLRICMPGRALKDGAMGELIPVELAAGKEKRVKGRVVGGGRVQIER